MKPSICAKCLRPVLWVVSSVTRRPVAVEPDHALVYVVDRQHAPGDVAPFAHPCIARIEHRCGAADEG